MFFFLLPLDLLLHDRSVALVVCQGPVHIEFGGGLGDELHLRHVSWIWGVNLIWDEKSKRRQINMQNLQCFIVAIYIMTK